MLVGAGFVVSAASADEYNSFHPLGGINPTTTIPQVYRDGSTGTLAQIGQMADGSVQQTDANQPNGYAKLDASGNMPLPVTGNASSASVITVSHNIPALGPTLGQLIADNAYIHSLGSTTVGLDGGIDAAILGGLLEKAVRPVSLRISSGEYLPAGQSSMIALPARQYNNVAIAADGQILNSNDEGLSGAAWVGGNISKQIGQSVLAQAFEPRYGIMRDRYYSDSAIFDYATKRKLAPISSDFYVSTAQWTSPSECSSSSNPSYDGYWCSQSNWGNYVHTDNIYTTSNVGITDKSVDFTSIGNGGGAAFDVEKFSRFHSKGTNWSWMNVSEFDEEGGLGVGGYTLNGTHNATYMMHYNKEADMTGMGLEVPDTSFNPFAATRYVNWFNAWYNGDESWHANSSMPQFKLLLVKNPSDNKDYMYINTAAGKTGSTEPTFTFNETTPVNDGTVKWLFQGEKAFQIGCLYCSGYDKSTADDNIEVGTLLASYLSIYNAGIDLSQLTYKTDIHAVLRTGTNSYLDLSADGTSAGQNNHLLGYGDISSSGVSALEYDVGKEPVFRVTDDGAIKTKITLNVSAAGTSIFNAPKISGDFVQITSAHKGAGISLSYTLTGTSITIRNDTNDAVNIYPCDSRWWFWGYRKGAPYVLLPHSAVGIKTIVGGYTLTEYSSFPHAPKSNILAIANAVEGASIYDTDDHETVTYRCPTATTCAWYPVEYGQALK